MDFLVFISITYGLVSVLSVLPKMTLSDAARKGVAARWFHVSCCGTVLSHPSIDLALCCSKSVPKPMAAHLGATRGLGMRPPTPDIACTRRCRSPSFLTSSPRLVWGNPHDTLINGRLDGVDFAYSVSILFTDFEPD